MANLRAKMGNGLDGGCTQQTVLIFVREHVVAKRYCMLMRACAALAVTSRVWALRPLWLWAVLEWLVRCELCPEVMSRALRQLRARRLAQGAVGAPTLTDYDLRFQPR
jgi:hypothetical protein